MVSEVRVVRLPDVMRRRVTGDVETAVTEISIVSANM